MKRLELISLAGYKPAATILDKCQTAESVPLDLENPIGMIEWLSKAAESMGENSILTMIIDPMMVHTSSGFSATLAWDSHMTRRAEIPFHNVVICPHCRTRLFWFECLEEGLVAHPTCPKCKHTILIIDSVARFDPSARKPPQRAR